MEKNIAYLGNRGRYTIFTFDDKTIRFITSKNLEKYVSIKEWNRGYIVVMAQKYGKEPEETYIDLCPILDNLLIDSNEFLNKIEEVHLI